MARSLTAVAARPRVTVQQPPDACYCIDIDALISACEQLGLTRPVAVAYRYGHRWDGIYMPANGGHRITVHALTSAENASRTLWHELEHARQEEYGSRDPRGTIRLRGSAAYHAHPDEVDARAREAMHDVLPLAFRI